LKVWQSSRPDFVQVVPFLAKYVQCALNKGDAGSRDAQSTMLLMSMMDCSA
jgi:hypothetical protein